MLSNNEKRRASNFTPYIRPHIVSAHDVKNYVTFDTEKCPTFDILRPTIVARRVG